MTDIVERLRGYSTMNDYEGVSLEIMTATELMDEAADEIERLQHVKANLHGHIKRLEDENSKLQAENAKLREALELLDKGPLVPQQREIARAALQKDEGK